MAISKLILNGEVQMDVTSDTVTAGSMLSGTTATKNDGTKATGTIATKTSSDLTASGATVTAPAGYYANAASKAVATTTHPNPSASITSSTGVVTASHTQTAGYVTAGTTTGTLNLTTQAAKTVTPTEIAQTAVSSYRWTTGSVTVASISSTYVGTGVAKKSSADLTASGSVVTAPAGYYSTAATKSVAAGSAFPPAVTITKNPTFSMNSATGVITASYTGSSSVTPTVTAGYISQGTAGTISTTGTNTYQLTSEAAATIYPSTADQTISSYRWLTGTQTIKSVTTSNLTAANIAEGVVVKVGDSNNASRIAQITGTYSGGGGGFTADQIAMRTMAGSISGNATAISTYAFASCYNLTTASFPSCTSIGSSAFYYCESLTTISFPFCTTIGNSVFYFCSNLTEANFPSCTSIGTYAFYGCYRLTTISFPSCTSIGAYAFYGCSNLTTVSFPSCRTISTNAFNYCSNLTTVNFPLVSIIGGSAFRSCSNLTTVSFPACTSISNYAFYLCGKLASVYLLTSTVPTLGATNTFGATNSSIKIYVPSSLYDSYKTTGNWVSMSSYIYSM